MENLTDLYETKLISEGIQAAWLKDKRALSVEFSDYFNPVSAVMITLVLTAVSFHYLSIYLYWHLLDWVYPWWMAYWYFHQSAYDKKMIHNYFKAHLTGVNDLQKANPSIVDKIHKKFFKCAL